MFRQKTVIYFAVVVLVGLALTLPFLSIQTPLNGLLEAQPVDAGSRDMFTPNHLLFRPLGFLVFKIGQALGYSGQSAFTLRYLTAFSAALGLGFFFLGLYRLTGSPFISAAATTLLGTSWAYWKFSTDIAYILPAAMCVCAALALLLQSEKPGMRQAALAGAMGGLAILFWQANIFLVPAFVLAILWVGRTKGLKTRLTLAAAFLVILGLTVSLVYILTPILVFGYTQPTDIIGWVASHSSDGIGRPPMWGKWGFDRLLPTGTNALASFIPIWQGLGIRNLLKGDLQPEKLVALASLLALVVLVGWAAFLLVRRQVKNRQPLGEIAWLFLAYLSYLPFIIWWEPYETRWFIIPNIFLIAAIAKIWSGEPGLVRRTLYLSGACIAVIATANFTATILPYHTVPNPRIQVAECFTQHATELDTFIITDWNWFTYATYFYDFRGKGLNLFTGEQNQQKNLDLIKNELVITHQLNGKLYAVDVKSYSQSELDYYQNQAGIPIGVLTHFEQRPAFKCNQVQFVRVVQPKQDAFASSSPENSDTAGSD